MASALRVDPPYSRGVGTYRDMRILMRTVPHHFFTDALTLLELELGGGLDYAHFIGLSPNPFAAVYVK